MRLIGKDVSFTIDGVDYAMRDVTIEQEQVGILPHAEIPPPPPRMFEGVATMHVHKGGIDKFLEALSPKPKGASFNTLVNRLKYGGRKGRSAWRRLWKHHSMPVKAFTPNMLVWRGRCLVLDPYEIHAELKVTGVRVPFSDREITF